ncbi:APC family permease [Brevibacillus sp. B_LB10_24]|uniref:APC family permease n=1 Tax=Brevibacillus sp. B_LB10_24 TaxID=3380645 RepID=UPI0038BBE27B
MSSTKPQQIRLIRNLSVWDAIVMSAAFMGPAVSMYFNTTYAAGFAGAAMPFAFLVSLFAALILANTIGEFSKIAPSAGAFYTFSVKGFGPRTGFITGWLMFLGYSVLEPAELALIGITVSDLLHSYLNLNIHWLIISLLAWALVLYVSYIGAKQSMKVSLYLFLAEVLVMVVLCIIVMAKGGFNGIHFTVFNPSLSPAGFSGIALGMIYGMLSFVGFESATTLAEEVRNPRKDVYRALMGSTLLVGLIYLFSTFTLVNGFGLDNMAQLASDVSPFVTIATNFGGPIFVLLIALAGISSILAVSINVHNAIARVVYVMGREKIISAALAKVHPKYHTPVNAVLAQGILSLVLMLIMGMAVGPSNTYGYLGALLTLGIIPVYMLAAFGFVRYQKRQGNLRQHPIRYGFLPIFAALIMLVPLIGSLYPVPPAPYSYLPYIVLIYLAAGYFVIRRLAQDPRRLEQVGMILSEADQGAEESV